MPNLIKKSLIKKQQILRIFLVFSFLLLGGANRVSANSSVTVNADQTLNINGVKTFPFAVYNLCDIDYDGKTVGGKYQDTCSEALGYMNNITVNLAEFGSGVTGSYLSTTVPLFTNSGIYWTAPDSGGSTWAPYRTTNKFFGYKNNPGEPPDWSGLAGMIADYNNLKASDPNHVVYNYHWKDMSTLAKVADVIHFEGQFHRTPNDPLKVEYPIEDWLFGVEYYAWNDFIKHDCGSCTSIADAGQYKSVWAGGWSPEAIFDTGTEIYYPYTYDQFRAESYMDITIGFKGLAWDVYKYGIYYIPPASHGFGTNKNITRDLNNLAGEIRSLNGILVLPTLNYAWGGYHSDSKVSFSNNITKTFTYYGAPKPSLNYTLKQDGNAYYLIIVNKTNNKITTDITLNNSGLSSPINAKTLGAATTTGSSAPGRIISLDTSGKFTDTFDGYAAHIYQICAAGDPCTIPDASPSPTPTPTPTPASTFISATVYQHGIWDNGDNTNPADTSLSNKSPIHQTITATLELFNTSNQLAGQGQGQLTYNSISGNYQGTIEINPNTLPSGSYILKIKTPNHLKSLIPGIPTINKGQTNIVPATTLITGDANDDNQLNIIDYNSLLNCYSDLAPALTCDPAKKISTDLDDDAFVNQIDYNLFLREIATQPGQ